MPRPGSRVATLLVTLVLGSLGLLLTPGTAVAACDCRGRAATQALREADTVFVGTVTGSRRVGRGDDARTDVRFRVDAVYKGAAFADQVVATPPDADGCGLEAEVGSSWVVFAVDGVEGSGDDAVSRLVTSRCRGSVTGAPPPVLGPGQPPTAGRSDREEAATNTDRALTRFLTTAGLVGLGLVVVAGAGLALLWRPRRPG